MLPKDVPYAKNDAKNYVGPISTVYGTYHEKVNRFRGLECGCELAEGFVRHYQSPTAAVPGL